MDRIELLLSTIISIATITISGSSSNNNLQQLHSYGENNYAPPHP